MDWYPPMSLAFAGTAGVPPAAARQIRESKSQLKQAGARTFHTTRARVALLLFKLELGHLLSRAGETPAVPANCKMKSSPSIETASGEPPHMKKASGTRFNSL
jgi:hypothetical protein